MSKPSKNQLTIVPVYAHNNPQHIATYRMFGCILGKKIRRQSTELADLVKEKEALTKQAADVQNMEQARPVATFLTVDQVREAETLFRETRACTRPLLDYVRAGVAAIGNGARVLATDARAAWEKKMRSVLVKTTKQTRMTNLNNLDDFLAHGKITHLDEITPEKIRLFLERELVGRTGGVAKTQTRLSHGLRLQAFINFCLEEGLLLTNPFKVNLEKMVKLAKQERDRPRILKPEQAEALLDATFDVAPAMVPYIILTTWCFIREAEALRLTPADVHLENKNPCVRLTGEKVGSKAARGVDIPANMVQLLRDCIATGLWAEDTVPYFSRKYFVTIRERAGLLKLGPAGNGGFRKVLSEGALWQSHILRHTGISYHFNLHGDITDTTRQAGNCPETAFDHYISLPHEGEAEAFYAITRTLKKDVAHADAHAVA